MPISEDIITGKKYRVWSVLANKWKRYSFWSKASDTELNDGTTVEATIGVLKSSIPQNKYYDSEAEAEADLNNIPDGALVYTNDEEELQDIIDGMTAIHLASSQLGAGTKNFTFNTEAHKRMLCITKKSGVIVESKEIPTDVLSTGDVIPLGQTAPIIGINNIPAAATLDTNLVNKELYARVYHASSSGLDYTQIGNVETGTGLAQSKAIGLAADLSDSLGASLTYNGNDSFTISVTDSTLSVYVYIDMLVLGGSASGRNVSFDAAGTDLVSTDVEGAIKEILNSDFTPELDLANAIELTTTEITTSSKGSIIGSTFNTNGINLLINDMNMYRNTNELDSVNITFIPVGTRIKLSAANNSACKIWFVPYK